MKRFSSAVISVAVHIAVAGILFLASAPGPEPVASIPTIGIRSALRPAMEEGVVEFRPDVRRPLNVPRDAEKVVTIPAAPVIPEAEPERFTRVVQEPPVRSSVRASFERLPLANQAPVAAAPPRGETVGAMLLADPAPEYPEIARRRRQEGEVVVELDVAPDGRVQSAQVYESSGIASLDEAALRAARMARYRPAMVNGEAVGARDRIRFAFRLE